MSQPAQVKLYHNPRCSKSRQTLQLLQEHGVEPDTIDYQKTPPSVAEIKHLLSLLGMSPRDLMRRGESIYKELNLDASDLSEDQLIQAMHDNPILIERPIVVIDQKHAALGRPPENILPLLEQCIPS